MYITLKLDEQEIKALEQGKTRTGIKASAVYIRYLIVTNGKEEKPE